MDNIKLRHGKIERIMAPVLMWPASCFAAHPLVTDDTGTLGKSGMQMEVNVDRSWSKSGASFSRSRVISPRTENTATVSRETLANLTLTYGWADQVDVSLNLPYQYVDATNSAKAQGIGDTGLELKWRFLEKNGISLALKPQLLLPTGNEQRELGSGRVSYGAMAVAAYEVDGFVMTH
jgi:hypothetical protein